MKQVLIENQVLNSPFEEPKRHFQCTEGGITDEIVEKRRLSSYFVSIAGPQKGRQPTFDSEWTQDCFKETEFINRVRERIKLWREQRWPGVTSVSTRLLDYWADPGGERATALFLPLSALRAEGGIPC